MIFFSYGSVNVNVFPKLMNNTNSKTSSDEAKNSSDVAIELERQLTGKAVKRIKADIEQVGIIDRYGLPSGWTFNGHGKGVGIEWVSEREIYYGGYTIHELLDVLIERGSRL